MLCSLSDSLGWQHLQVGCAPLLNDLPQMVSILPLDPLTEYFEPVPSLVVAVLGKLAERSKLQLSPGTHKQQCT